MHVSSPSHIKALELTETNRNPNKALRTNDEMGIHAINQLDENHIRRNSFVRCCNGSSLFD